MSIYLVIFQQLPSKNKGHFKYEIHLKKKSYLANNPMRIEYKIYCTIFTIRKRVTCVTTQHKKYKLVSAACIPLNLEYSLLFRLFDLVF